MAMLTVEQIKKLIEDNRLDIFYNSKFWRRFSRKVKQEQNNECQICKSRGKYSPAKILHHVKHLKERPDLAYSRYYTDENGAKHRQLLAVCFSCHEELHGRTFKVGTRPRKGYTNEEKF